MGSRLSTKIVLALAIVFLLSTAFIIGYLAILMNNPNYPVESYVTDSGTHVTITHDTSAPKIMMYFCSPAGLILGIFLLFYWRRRKRDDKLIADLPSYLRMYRRSRPEKVAARMGITEAELRRILDGCIAKGIIQGQFDPRTGEFVIRGTEFREMHRRCPNCGAELDTFLEGEEVRCRYCNQVADSKII